MALADIIRRIAEDARREADDLVLAAERSAEETRQEARVRAQFEHDSLVARGRAEAEAEGKTRLASARLGERDRMLAAKGALVRRVLDDAISRLESLPDEEYAALIAREVSALARGGEHVALGESDSRRLATFLPPAIARIGTDIEIAGTTGAIGMGALLLGERMRVEVSARALVEGRADHLSAVAGEILFGEADESAKRGA